MLKAESRADSRVTSDDGIGEGQDLGSASAAGNWREAWSKEETLGKFSLKDTSDPSSPPSLPLSLSVLKVLGEISS